MKLVEGGLTFKLKPPRQDAQGRELSTSGVTGLLKRFNEVMETFMPERQQKANEPPRETTHGVWTLQQGLEPTYKMHVLRITAAADLKLYAKGKLELAVGFDNLGELIFEPKGENLPPASLLRIRYSGAIARPWWSISDFGTSGELCLIMKTHEIDILDRLFAEWCPQLKRTPPRAPPPPQPSPRASAPDTPRASLSAAAATFSPSADLYPRTVISGKLEVQLWPWLYVSRHVALTSLGQLVISDSSGSVPQQIVNMLAWPVHSSGKAIMVIASNAGAIRLRAIGDDDGAKDKERVRWMSEMEAIVTQLARHAHSHYSCLSDAPNLLPEADLQRGVIEGTVAKELHATISSRLALQATTSSRVVQQEQAEQPQESPCTLDRVQGSSIFNIADAWTPSGKIVN